MNENLLQGGKGSTGILTNKQAIARKFNVKQNEVVYFSVGVELGGYKVIYDKSTQRAYSLPTLEQGTSAVSLSNTAILIHSKGTVDLGELAVERSEFIEVPGSFGLGGTLYTKADTLSYMGNRYRYLGELPLVVEPGTVPDSLWFSEDKITEKNTRELWRRSLAEIGLTLVPGSFKEGATVNSATDAVWDIDGAQCYTWTGDFPHDAEGEPGAGWVGVIGRALTKITAEMFGARGLPHDDSLPLKRALQAANDLGLPFELTQDLGYNGELNVDPKGNNKSLIINGNGHTIYRLVWDNPSYRGIKYGDGWYETRPTWSGASLTINNLILDGNFKEEYVQWDAPTAQKPASGFMLWTSAENVKIDGLCIQNSYRHGFSSMFTKNANINNYKTRNLGGKAYEPGDHDSYTDPLLFRCLLADARIVLNDLDFVALGYPTSPMSRIGMSIQISDGDFEVVMNNPSIKGFERSIHIEETSGYYTLTIDGAKFIGTYCGVHTTRGAGAIYSKPTVNISNSTIEVCKNTFYKPGDFAPPETYVGWVRHSQAITEDSSLGAVFNLNNCILKITAGLDGVVYPVSWGGNVNMIGGSIDYSNTNSVKNYGYLRAKGVVMTGLSTTGQYFNAYAKGTRNNTIELEGCEFYRSGLASPDLPVRFHHTTAVRDEMDYAINCKTTGFITLPIDPCVPTGNKHYFETKDDLIKARNVSTGMRVPATSDFPSNGCSAAFESLRVYPTLLAKQLVGYGYVTASEVVDIKKITEGFGAGVYTLILAPSAGSTSVNTGGSLDPIAPERGKLYLVINVRNNQGALITVGTPTRFGRDLTADGLDVVYNSSARTFGKATTNSASLVNIPWAIYAGDVSASIFKG